MVIVDSVLILLLPAMYWSATCLRHDMKAALMLGGSFMISLVISFVDRKSSVECICWTKSFATVLRMR